MMALERHEGLGGTGATGDGELHIRQVPSHGNTGPEAPVPLLPPLLPLLLQSLEDALLQVPIHLLHHVVDFHTGECSPALAGEREEKVRAQHVECTELDESQHPGRSGTGAFV